MNFEEKCSVFDDLAEKICKYYTNKSQLKTVRKKEKKSYFQIFPDNQIRPIIYGVYMRNRENITQKIHYQDEFKDIINFKLFVYLDFSYNKKHNLDKVGESTLAKIEKLCIDKAHNLSDKYDVKESRTKKSIIGAKQLFDIEDPDVEKKLIFTLEQLMQDFNPIILPYLSGGEKKLLPAKQSGNHKIKNELELSEVLFPEGKAVEKIHIKYERNNSAVLEAKKQFYKKNEKFFCEVCNFDFVKKYGSIADKFIEAHHTIPLSKMKDNHKTRVEDLVLLCSNCHSIVHLTEPCLTIEELKKLVADNVIKGQAESAD